MRELVGGMAPDDDRFVFARSVRRFVGGYVALVVLACLVLASSAEGARAYVEAMVIVWCVCFVPGVVIAWRAGRRVSRTDRLVWRLWIGGFVLGGLSTVRLISMSDEMFASLQRRSVPTAVVLVILLVATNTMILRSRSGQRAVLIDVADIAMALVAVLAPLALLVAAPIVQGESAWFTGAAALWFVGALYGTAVALVLTLRVQPADRAVARFGVIFGAVALVATAAQTLNGVNDFGLPPGPFLALHALCAGFTVLFFLHSTLRPSVGLERLPARAQVRRRPAVTLLVLVSIPVTGVALWWRLDDDWAIAVALGAAGSLVVLFCIRSLLAARETRLLYRDVERSADERGELLTDVLAHAEVDRHRVATHLHRQSVRLSTALAALADPVGGDTGGAGARVAEALRADLARQSDELRRFAQAVRPQGDGRGAPSLATPLRAQLDGLYPEGHHPDLVAEVDPDLALDWTDEAVLVRVAEEALRVLALRAPDATVVSVGLFLDAGPGVDVILDLVIDGRAEGATEPDGPELSPIRAGAELLGGTVAVIGDPGHIGIRVRVPFGDGRSGSAPRPPALRVVR